LTSLSLRYNVSSQSILKYNSLWGEMALTLETHIKIPPKNWDGISRPSAPEVSKEQRSVYSFQRLTDCTETSVVEYYLKETQYDIQKAVAKYRIDMSWEASQSSVSRPTLDSLSLSTHTHTPQKPSADSHAILRQRNVGSSE